MSPRFLKPLLDRLEDRLLLSGNTQIQLYGAYTLDSYAGVGFKENEVATMQAQLNGQPDTNKSDFTAEIQWGDGASSAGDFVYLGVSGSWADYLIKGSHVYNDPGTMIHITLTANGPNGTSASFATNDIDYANVTAMPSGIPGTQPTAPAGPSAPTNTQILLYGAYTLDSYAGVGFQENEVGTVQVAVNGQPYTTQSNLQAQINWGDSASWSMGDLVYEGTSGNYADYIIKGSHVYQTPDTSIPIVVYFTGPDGTSASFATNDIDYANVTAMPSGIPGTQPSAPASPSAPTNTQILLYGAYTLDSYAGVGFQENEVGTVQVAVNGQPYTTLSNLQAQINWGDSASWSKGDLVYEGTSGNYADYIIKGSHDYQTPVTNKPIVVYFTGPDGTSVSFATNDIDYANVTAMPSGIPGTQPSAPASPSAPADVRIELYGAYTLDSYVGVGFQEEEVGTVQVAVNGQADKNLGDFNAQINWGDSASWYAGNLTYTGTSGGYADYIIKGSHVYQKTGTNIPIVVYFTGPDGTSDTFATNDIDYANVSPNPNAISLGSLSPAQWQQNKPGYDGTISVMGGTGGYQNLQVSGLPTGLSATVLGSTVNGQQSGTITISGTPTKAGTFTLATTLQDGDGDTGNGSESLTITVVPLTLGALSPMQWQQNKPGYDGTISVTGGAGGYQDLQVSGLPAGLSATVLGSTVNGQQSGTITISGTPTQAGTFTLATTLQAGDGDSGSGSESLTITAAPITLGNLIPTQWAVNQPGYSGTIAVTGGTGGYQNLKVSGLPTGLSASVSSSTANGQQNGTITISGTPTQIGAFTLMTTLQDGDSNMGSGTESLTIFSTSLVWVTFSGAGFRPITSDVDPTFPSPSATYTTQQWQAGAVPRQRPVLYAANSVLTVSADWTDSMAPPATGSILAKATTSNGLTIAPTPVTASGGALVLSPVTATGTLGNVAKLLPHLVIQWQLSFDGGTSWVTAGTSDNPLYVSASTNPLPDPEANEYFLTVVDSEVNVTSGLTAGGTTDNTGTIIGNTWNLFSSHVVKQISLTAPFASGSEQGKALTYYGTAAPGDAIADTTQQLYWTGYTLNNSVQLLLASHDGECMTFAELYLDMLLVSGVSQTGDLITIEPVHSDGFLVNNWKFVGTGTSGNDAYPFIDVPAQLATDSLGNVYGINNQYQVQKQPGAAGQNSPNPAALFNNHVIVELNGKIYDPSYGTTYSSVADLVDHAFAGFFDWVSSIPPSVLGIASPGVGPAYDIFVTKAIEVQPLTPSSDLVKQNATTWAPSSSGGAASPPPDIVGQPISTVDPLSSTSAQSDITVRMTGADDGGKAGVASFDLFVSSDGGPFVLDKSGIPAQAGTGSVFTGSTTFTGVPGHSYSFYSLATDSAGKVESVAGTAQETVTILKQPTPTPTPSPTPTKSAVIGEQPLFQRKLKKGKPVGAPVLAGFTLEYRIPLSSANAANFQVDSVTLSRVKRKTQQILHPIKNFKISYVAATNAVEIVFGSQQAFPTGGQITVLSGMTTASGSTLTGNANFTISKGGKHISLSS